MAMMDPVVLSFGGTPLLANIMKQQLQVTLRIREMILQGELAPGQRGPEATIAQQLGISRTPVRADR